MKFLAAVLLLSVLLASTSYPNRDSPTGFDNKSNGMVDDATHQHDQAKFDDIETVGDGLGPLYNAQSCRECHLNPTSGGTSRIAELRTLVNDRSICPNAAFPDTEIQEHVPDSENIRTTRISLGVLGDGFVEAVSVTKPPPRQLECAHCNLAYSALAFFRMGMSGSASFPEREEIFVGASARTRAASA